MSDPFGEWPPNSVPPVGGPYASQGYPPVFGGGYDAHGWGAQQPGWPPPPPPPRRNGALIAILAVVAVMVAAGLVAGGWALAKSGENDSATAGPSTSGRSAAPLPSGGGGGSSSGGTTGQSASSQCSTAITDGTGDTTQMYDDEGDYNRSDIVEVSVECANDELTVAMTFAPGVDMTVAGFAALIDADPDAGTRGGHACDGSNTEDFSLSVDGSARSNDASLLDTTSCATPYPVLWSSSSMTSGHTMAASVPFSQLGIHSGDSITFRAFSSTYLPPNLIDPGQDDAPDRGSVTIPIS